MPDKKEAIVMDAQQGTVRPHHPGQDVFRSVLSEDIDWKPFAAFPPSVHLAVVVGQRPEARGRVLHGREADATPHSEDRVYIVVSGVFYIGLGDQFNPDKLQMYPTGSVMGKSSEYVTQVTGNGPASL